MRFLDSAIELCLTPKTLFNLPFGYRRLAILLRREGKGMNLKKVYRLYREERLRVRKRSGRKRAQSQPSRPSYRELGDRIM